MTVSRCVAASSSSEPSNARQLVVDERADVPQDEAEPGVGEVLHGRAVVDVLAGGVRHDALQFVDQPERRVAGAAGLGGDPVQVEPPGVGVLGDRPRRLGRDDPQRRLGPRECRQDVQPALQPLPLLEQPVQLGSGPQMPVGHASRPPGSPSPSASQRSP